jgi:trehalose synthase
MTHLQEVQVGIRSIEKYRDIIGNADFDPLLEKADSIRGQLNGRVIWNVNSTARGGGVAEMLRPMLAYVRSLGVDARWAVINGTEDFFHLTKRIHHALHGSAGDGSPIDESRRDVYEEVMERTAHELFAMVEPGDVVILHDPQTAGLIPHALRAKAATVWRCHIGHDSMNAEVLQGWEFLKPYLGEAHRLIFSREAYIPPQVDKNRTLIIPPAIDAFSPKNQDMDDDTIRAILVHAGIVEGPPGDGTRVFEREDGSRERVDRRADIIRMGRAPSWETPLVVQVSRWDSLKDHLGVMEGFARLADGAAPGGAELVLVGPNVHAVADDPEGAAVLDEIEAAWRALPHGTRNLVNLVSLPMADAEENAAMVNAIQRHAAVVVQKSLHEGFGLTVTEAMWKARPVVASKVGGIQDQVRHGKDGLLIDDAKDLDAFGDVLRQLLEDPRLGEKMGKSARERVRENYLVPRTLASYADLILELTEEGVPIGANRK